MDINSNFINFAKSKLKDSKFEFIVEDALLFKTDKRFDIILATSSYHHIQDAKKKDYLRNVSNHLKKDGIFVVYEKLVGSFSNNIEAVDVGTKFYLERIKYMMKNEALTEKQVFALFNELYLTAIRKEEYKVDLNHFKMDIDASGFRIEKIIKLWPENDVFDNKKVGDFVFLIIKKYTVKSYEMFINIRLF